MAVAGETIIKKRTLIKKETFDRIAFDILGSHFFLTSAVWLSSAKKGIPVPVPVCLFSFWNSLEKNSVGFHFLKTAAPDEFTLMHRYIRTAVAHILPAVAFEIYGLNNHQAL